MEKENNLQVAEEIEHISHKMGLSKKEEKTVIEVSKGGNQDEKCCVLKSGSWDGGEPWFVIDEDKNLHTLVSMESLSKLVESLKQTQQENFNLKLEKTIWQHIPVDFGDAWTVAMDEIKKLSLQKPNAKSINVNLNHLVENIKKNHPNLFLNIDDFMPHDMKRLH